MPHARYDTPGSGKRIKPAVVAHLTDQPLPLHKVDVQAGERQQADFLLWRDAGHQGLVRLDAHLGTRPFMVGSALSVADVAVHGYTHLAEEGGFELSRYPAVQAWLQRIKERMDGGDIATLLPA